MNPLITLTPNQAPIELASNVLPSAPLLIINDSAVRAYVGDSAVSSVTGTPVDPYTSLSWPTPGDVWAIADPAGAGPVTLRLTTNVSDWTPSPATVALLVADQMLDAGIPAAIATQTAANLLATGVPNVLRETVITNGSTLAPGAQQTWDVSGYAAVYVYQSNSQRIQVSQIDPSGLNLLDFETNFSIGWVRLVGTQLRLLNPGGNAATTVTIIGSNRQPTTRIDGRTSTATGESWTNPGGASLTNGQIVTLTSSFGAPGQQGAAIMSARLGPGAKGRLEIVTATGDTHWLVDSAEMLTSSSGTLALSRAPVALPMPGYVVQFHSTAIQTGPSVSVHFIPQTI